MSAAQFLGPFNKSVYVKRRANLMQKLQARSKDFVCLIFSGHEQARNQDNHFMFRAYSHFLYLTGFSEPESLLVLSSVGGKKKSHLFLRERDLSPDRGSEIWEGERLGVARARSVLGVDQAYAIEESEQVLEALLGQAATVFWRFSEFSVWDHKLLDLAARLRNPRARSSRLGAFMDPSFAVDSLRKVKSKEELEWMRQAAWIASQGHIRAMQSIRPDQFEYEVQAEAEREFRRHGSESPAYNSICASGNNACTLHYRENNRRMREGDLMLMDAGAELSGYASDITRTFPVSRKFSDAQKEVYQWVLRAQLAAIQAVRVGSAWDRPHQEAVKVIAKALRELRVLKESESVILKKKLWRRYMPHGTSHWIGLDVHDVGEYYNELGKSLKLEVGNVLTIEPGLYFREDDPSVPKKYRGIGVRIEDDVAVTRGGHDVLSLACPKTIGEIESLRAPRM